MRNKAEAAAEVTAIVKFLVDVDGKSYPCDRRVSGRTRKRQKIFVAGIGSQADPTSYLAGRLAIPAMEEMARTIARELIEGAPERVGWAWRSLSLDPMEAAEAVATTPASCKEPLACW